jgi:polar amino acid transport system substrate-binding protein
MKWKLLLLALMLSSASAGVGAEEEVVFAVGEYPPFLSKDAPHYGISAKVVAEASRRAHLTPVFKFMPWPRAEHDTAQGKYLASVGWARTPMREKTFSFSRYPVIIGAPTAAFYKRSRFTQHPMINSWKDLAALDVVGVNAYWYKEFFENAGVRAYYVSSAELAWQLIAMDRKAVYVDGLSTGLVEGKKALGKSFDDISYILLPFDDPNSYIMYSQNNVKAASLRNRLDTALESMAKDGTLDKLAQLPAAP